MNLSSLRFTTDNRRLLVCTDTGTANVIFKPLVSDSGAALSPAALNPAPHRFAATRHSLSTQWTKSIEDKETVMTIDVYP
ncbi:unnamed protein product [Merluccius merluccius]